MTTYLEKGKGKGEWKKQKEQEVSSFPIRFLRNQRKKRKDRDPRRKRREKEKESQRKEKVWKIEAKENAIKLWFHFYFLVLNFLFLFDNASSFSQSFPPPRIPYLFFFWLAFPSRALSRSGDMKPSLLVHELSPSKSSGEERSRFQWRYDLSPVNRKSPSNFMGKKPPSRLLELVFHSRAPVAFFCFEGLGECDCGLNDLEREDGCGKLRRERR